MNRCYYAGFRSRSRPAQSWRVETKHAGVISAFGQLVIKGQGVDERAGRLLRSLYDRRSQADYDLGPVPQEVADQAIEDAETVAGTIGDWLEESSE